jgi:hypothetical protein
VVVIDDDADPSATAEPAGTGDPEAGGQGARSVADIGATLQDQGGPRRRRWRLFRKGGD